LLGHKPFLLAGRKWEGEKVKKGVTGKKKMGRKKGKKAAGVSIEEKEFFPRTQ